MLFRSNKDLISNIKNEREKQKSTLTGAEIGGFTQNVTDEGMLALLHNIFLCQ